MHLHPSHMYEQGQVKIQKEFLQLHTNPIIINYEEKIFTANAVWKIRS